MKPSRESRYHRGMSRITHLATAAVLALAALPACKSGQPAKCAETTAGTAGEGLKTGGTTAVEGVKTFGKSVGGLFDGGTDAAKQEWKQGSKNTASAAKGGGGDTKGAAKQVDCK